MKPGDTVILGGAVVLAGVAYLAFKGKFHLPAGVGGAVNAAGKGATSAPVPAAQRRADAYKAPAAAPAQADVPSYGQSGYTPQSATDAQGSYDPNAPAAAPDDSSSVGAEAGDWGAGAGG